MPASSSGNAPSLRRPIQVLIVSSVMFTFISYWRTAAVVLCDLASTAYYIGGIVEGAIGPAAPWFILAVMLFSYAVRSIYIESSSLFVRGGVYRVVKEAMGGFLAKLSVSALMFDYILTGPTSAVSAGQYILGLLLDGARIVYPDLQIDPATADVIRRWGAVAIAVVVTLYFFRQNLLGIHESSGKALKIMIAMTVMAVVMLIWCGLTLWMRGPVNSVPWKPDLRPKVVYEEVVGPNPVTGEETSMWLRDPQTGDFVAEKVADANGRMVDKPKMNDATGHQEDPLGLVSRWFPGLAEHLRSGDRWWSWWGVVGVVGLVIAFGHSILAMSGEETLAQVYREVESPKLKNFKKAAFIVFVYSLGLTASISFLAVLLIPDEVRMKLYSDNLIGGLAMHVVGPPTARLALNAIVVIVGFLILSGAVNTAIIGSNGVLNRVAEDGVVPDWFLKPHKRYGTTYRILVLIVGLQLLTIVLSRGDMYVLGEAYAFGVVWSFVFKALAMIVLRFKDRSPREFKVPGNVRIGGIEWPIGLGLVFAVLLATALLNLLTKEVATIGGASFTAVFLIIFIASEHFHERKRSRAGHVHLEQFNQRETDAVEPVVLGLDKPFRKVVAIRSTQNLYMLERTLAEADPETTDTVVMTAQVPPRGEIASASADLDSYNRTLMTAVVTLAEKAGKHVQPLIVRTNNPVHAVVETAKSLGAQELVLGVSNIHTADDQIESIAFYWIALHGGAPRPLTVRLLSSTRDISFDLAGGNRIPKIGERRARSVAELRAAGVGVSKVLLVCEDTAVGSDLFAVVLTMLDPQVRLGVARLPSVAPGLDSREAETAKSEPATIRATAAGWLDDALRRAERVGRELHVHDVSSNDPTGAVLELAGRLESDLVILASESAAEPAFPRRIDIARLVRTANSAICVVSMPQVPDRVEA